MDAHDHLTALLSWLKLTALRDQLDNLIDEAGRRELTICEALTMFCERQVARRDQRRIDMALGVARFPFMRDLAGFDFGVQPSLDKEQIREIATGRFIANGEAVLLLGPPGVCKSHVAVALGREAIVPGYTVLFTPATTLVAQLAKAHGETFQTSDRRRRSAMLKPEDPDQSVAAPAPASPRLVLALLSISKSTRALTGPKLAQLGFASDQDVLLLALDEEKPVSVTALADLVRVRPSTISKMIDRLVDKGLVERVASSTDLRKTMVQITQSGLDAPSLLLDMRAKLETNLVVNFAGDTDATIQAPSRLSKSYRRDFTGCVDSQGKGGPRRGRRRRVPGGARPVVGASCRKDISTRRCEGVAPVA